MKRFFVLVLALVLGCTMLCAVAEEQPQYLPPRDAALAIMTDINDTFDDQPGAIVFNLIYQDENEGIVFGSETAESCCVMKYDENMRGVQKFYFMSDDVNEALMCASMTYYFITQFLGEDVEVVNWIDNAYLEIVAHVDAGGEELYQEYPLTVGENEFGVVFVDFFVEDDNGKFAVGVLLYDAMMVRA